MSKPNEDRDPLEVLAAEFMERRRCGHDVSISQYAQRHPELAEEIHELFPAIAAMERLKAHKQQSSGGRVSLGGVRLDRLGDFCILGEIGRGGMGIVYEAFQESLGRHVAVKVLPKQALLDPKHLQRFEREAQTAARLHHTNIVPVFGVGEQEGYHYIVMQLIQGVGLDVILTRLQEPASPGGVAQVTATPSERRRPGEATYLAAALVQGQFWQSRDPGFSGADRAPGIPSYEEATDISPWQSSTIRLEAEDLPNDRDTEASAHATTSAVVAPTPARGEAWRFAMPYWRGVATIGLQVAEALHYAHGHRTLHRDIKPANLLLDAQGIVWITDFGLAKAMEQDNVTQTDALVGTLRYMAPEQFSGQFDARSDVYSLGLTLYEFLTLQPAFADSNRSSLIRKITHDEPVRPCKINAKIPRDLETIVLKAIAREPADRYQTAGEFARDLECFLEDRPIRARRTPPIERLWRWSRRNRAVASLSAVALALLVLVAVVASAGFVRTKRANIEEARQREKAEATSALALEALDNIFQQFAPDRTVTPAGLTVVSDAGEEISVAVQPVLSKEAAVLLEHMLVFYDRLAGQGGDDANLHRKVAEANRRVGDIRQRLGHWDQAKTAYLRAIELYERLLGNAPQDPEFLTAKARIQNELGSVLGATDDLPRAHDAHIEALTTLDAVPAEYAGLASYRYELARTYYLLSRRPQFGPPPPGPGRRRDRPREADIALRPPGPREAEGVSGLPGPAFDRGRYHDHGDRGFDDRGPGDQGPDWSARSLGPPDANHGPPPKPQEPRWMMDRRQSEDYLHKAVGLLEELVAQHPSVPDYRHLLARCYRELSFGWPGRNLKTPAATTDKASEILEKLVADFPDVPDYRYDLSETYAMLDFRLFFPWGGKSPAEEDGWQAAVQSAELRLRKALEISEKLVAEHPNVPDYAMSQVHIHLRLAGLVRPTDPQKAEESLRKAMAVQSSLVKRFPKTISYQMSMSIVYQSLADLLRERGQLPEARSLMDSSIKVIKDLIRSEPKLEHLRGVLAFNYLGMAQVLRQMGDAEGAAEVLRQADQLRPQRDAPPNMP